MPSFTTKIRERIVQLRKGKYGEGSRSAYPKITLNESELNKLEDFPTNTFHTTKYNPATFIPKVLFEQFRKATSFYFLLIVIISLIPQISPITPWTSVAGLVFILVAAAIREAYEDFLRRKADRKVNMRKYLAVDERDGGKVMTRAKWLKVGDLVFIRNGEQMPSDVVLLASGNDDGVAFIETSQLDGETNLKQRKAPEITSSLSLEELSFLQGFLECETPHHQLYSFKATLQVDGQRSFGLDAQQLLLMGSTLLNTPYIVGIIAYSGPETKLSLNQKKPPSKFSRLDKRLNHYVYGLFLLNVILCTGMAIGAGIFNYKYAEDSPYLLGDSGGSVVSAIKIWFSYFALLSYLIPLSLVVSLEGVKVVQARFMEWDEKMMHEGKAMSVKTSNLNDELGLVQYIFSDKTGTLTENQMDFLKCSINGVVYEEATIGQLHRNSLDTSGSKEEKDILDFMLCMSLCHTVITDKDLKTDELIYKASSPDEEALCQAAADFGVKFLGRKKGNSIIQIGNIEDGDKLEIEVLCTMEFTSDRRRMSVIVRYPDDTIKLLSKGADSMMYSRLADGDDKLKSLTSQHLDKFSKDGLRTLIYAWKDMSEDEWNEFDQKYNSATSLVDGREDAVEAVCSDIEKDLFIIGCTAIEDKLQNNVPQTIAYLLEAGIRVWVITGDKQATAINIGYSSRLLTPKMNVVKINADSSEQCASLLEDAVSKYGGKSFAEANVAMVIDGDTLKYALIDYPEQFLEFAKVCHSVICNRVTPLQKAQVVRLVKTKTNSVCLSIGDGANDVSMIQEANIGVGIFGKEGNQAARSADFALRQFSHLSRLLCVHGRYSIIRNAFIVHYSFYKNAAIFLVQLWFGLYCGFSAQTFYDDWIMTFFNITITAAPPVIVGVFEIDISPEVIEREPRCFSRTQKNTIFTLVNLFSWLGSALYHSLVLFFGMYFVDQQGGFRLVDNEQEGGFFLIGNIVFFIGMVVIFGKLAIEINYWNWLTHVSLWGSMLVYIITIILEASLEFFFPNQFFVFFNMLKVPTFYSLCFATVAICLLPDFAYKYIRRHWKPENWMILQEIERKHKARKRPVSSGISFPLGVLSRKRNPLNKNFPGNDYSMRSTNNLNEPLLVEESSSYGALKDEEFLKQK